jgi:hypothetical protein
VAQALTTEELLALPAIVDLPTAGRAFGIGRTKAHELARNGEFPCPVLRVGHTYRVGRAAILRCLDIPDPALTSNPGPAETADAHS